MSLAHPALFTPAFRFAAIANEQDASRRMHRVGWGGNSLKKSLRRCSLAGLGTDSGATHAGADILESERQYLRDRRHLKKHRY